MLLENKWIESDVTGPVTKLTGILVQDIKLPQNKLVLACSGIANQSSLHSPSSFS